MRPDNIQSILEDIRMDAHYSDAALAATAATGILFADTVAGKHKISHWGAFPDIAVVFARQTVEQYLKSRLTESQWEKVGRHAEFVAWEYAVALVLRVDAPRSEAGES